MALERDGKRADENGRGEERGREERGREGKGAAPFQSSCRRLCYVRFVVYTLNRKQLWN